MCPETQTRVNTGINKNNLKKKGWVWLKPEFGREDGVI